MCRPENKGSLHLETEEPLNFANPSLRQRGGFGFRFVRAVISGARLSHASGAQGGGPVAVQAGTLGAGGGKASAPCQRKSRSQPRCFGSPSFFRYLHPEAEEPVRSFSKETER